MAALKSIPFFIQTWSSAASDISGASHNKPEDGHREEYRGACEERLGGSACPNQYPRFRRGTMGPEGPRKRMDLIVHED